VSIECIDEEGKDFAIKFLMGENFVKNYINFVGHKNLIVHCKICGKPFERKGSRQVMCEECSKKERELKNKLRQR
jgi:predicted nucleic acid-binding Zn ribbon protein